MRSAGRRGIAPPDTRANRRPTSRTSRRCCVRCGACRSVVARPDIGVWRRSRHPTGERSTPTAHVKARSSRSGVGRRASVMTPSSCLQDGTKRWPSSPMSRRIASATGGGPSAHSRRSSAASDLHDRALDTLLKVATPSVESSQVEPTDAVGRVMDRRVLRSTKGFFDGKSPLLVAVLGLAFIAVVSVLDYLTGLQFSLSLLYLMPIGLVTWNLGRRWGAVAVVVSTVAGLVSDVLSSPATSTT